MAVRLTVGRTAPMTRPWLSQLGILAHCLALDSNVMRHERSVAGGQACCELCREHQHLLISVSLKRYLYLQISPSDWRYKHPGVKSSRFRFTMLRTLFCKAVDLIYLGATLAGEKHRIALIECTAILSNYLRHGLDDTGIATASQTQVGRVKLYWPGLAKLWLSFRVASACQTAWTS
ncbi:hypothetical protein B0J12DRAFT_63343 [Macrophomina phaseolina]|uniref:Uncharacterized protein n=1 Tax=Macrophomina phaseolina TaxID=35725 RepID=A0ABQ8GCL5_9PEZI|nr:hypothetical protein B0J12DRAFT_63343 [Macrophomina phaseolina]